MKNQKKGQAAMEFLMTYGWAILAAIIVIAVIAIYFRPGSMVQNTVTIAAPFNGGTAITINSTMIAMEISNNVGVNLDLPTNPMSLTFTSPTTAVCPVASVTYTGGLTNFTAGEKKIITFGSCTELSSGDTINANLVIQYQYTDSALVLQQRGSVSGKVA